MMMMMISICLKDMLIIEFISIKITINYHLNQRLKNKKTCFVMCYHLFFYVIVSEFLERVREK